jgi:hypothetical protein
VGVCDLSTINLSIKSKIIIITPTHDLPLQSQPPGVQLHDLPQQGVKLTAGGLQLHGGSDSGLLLNRRDILRGREKTAALLQLGRNALVLLAEDASLLAVVLDDELGGGVGDGQLSGSLVDGVFLVLDHLDQSQPLLSPTHTTLKEIFEYCAFGLA